MIDEYVSEILELEDKGFVVIIKWDGERTSNKRTVVITKPAIDDCYYRKDTDNIEETLVEGLLWANSQESKT